MFFRTALLLLGISMAIAACGDGGSERHDVIDATDVPDTTDTIDATDTIDTIETIDMPDTIDASDGDGETIEPGPSLVTERFGARLWGPIIQMSKTGRLLWLGTRGNPDPVTGELRAGLYRIDLDSGVVRHYEDELPLEDYHDLDVFIPEGTFGPAPTAGVQAYDQRFLAVAHTGLLVIDGSSVTPFPLSYEGTALVPIQVALGGGATPVAWLTSDRGLMRLDPTTFAVEAVIDGAALALPGDSGGGFGKLALDPESGAVYAAYYATDGVSRVVRADVAGEISVLTPGGGLPSGLVGDLVWSAAAGRVYVALGAWNADQGGVIAWDGATATEIVREGPLGAAHSGASAAFGAQVLALDDERGWLAVGGQVQSGFAGTRGGGLVVVDVGRDPAPVVGLARKTTPLYHWHTQHLAWDGESGRLYAAMSDLCSEVKLRNRGLFALRVDDLGEVHYERPLLSGVRAIAFDDRDDEVPLLGLRDDNGGLACEGYPIQSGLGRPQAGGSMTLVPVITDASDGNGGILLDPGITAIDAAEGGLALGTYRDGFFLGRLEDGRAIGFTGNQALLGPSLYTEAVLHEGLDGGGADAMWIAGRTSHAAEDPPQLADRGPRGAARIVVADGRVESVTHYVRASEDPDDVVGLPSSDVRELLREEDGSVIAVCATERLGLVYDRMETEPFEVDGVSREGGLARLSGDRVEIVAGPEVFPDPRAAARDAAGRLVVADAERGVWRQRGDADWEQLALDGLPGGAVPQAIWAGDDDDMAVATSLGVWVRLSGRVAIRDDIGFAWALAWHGDRLWVGSDVGLVVIRPSTSPPTNLPAPAAGASPFSR